MTDGFTFFANYGIVGRQLPKNQRLEFYDALVSVAIYGEEPDIKSDTVRVLITALTPTLTKSAARMSAGKSGGTRKKRASSAEENGEDDPENENFALQAKPRAKNQANEKKRKEKEIDKNLSYPPTPQTGDARESKTSEASLTECDELFKTFWTEYPKREARQSAEKVFRRLYRERKLDSSVMDVIIADLRRRKPGTEWTRENGRYIPLPASYLSGMRGEGQKTEIAEPNSSFDTDEFFQLALKRSFTGSQATQGGQSDGETC